MTRERFSRSALSLGIAFILSNGLTAETTLRIESENQQAITHWGMATMNRPDWGPEFDLGNYPQSLQALYADIGANIVRFHIDYRVGIPGNRQRDDLKQAILNATDRGMQWYALPWSPPVEMKTINNPNGAPKGELNYLKEGYEDDVAAWLTELVVWLRDEGVPLPVGIGPQNESDFGPPGYPGCVYTAEQMQTTIVELRKALDAAGLEEVLVIADDGAKPVDDMYPGNRQFINSGTVNMMGLEPGGAFDTNSIYRDAVGVIATHTYDLHNNLYQARPDFLQEFYNATHGTGKPVWMTEFEITDTHVSSEWEILSENVLHFNRDISSMAFNAWFYWHLWQGDLMGEGSADEGDCLGRIRINQLVYNDVELGDSPSHIALRYSTSNSEMKVTIRLGGADGEVIGEAVLPKTTNGSRLFETLQIPITNASGQQAIAICFETDIFWKEAALNWFQVEGQQRIEAESVDVKTGQEKWTASVIPCYNMHNRMHAVYDDGEMIQLRPIYYFFEKLWNAAPAGKSYVRRVSSSTPAFRGESKEAVVESARQDLSAFITEERMTVVMVNRQTSAEAVRIEGLSGSKATLYTYLKEDASSINQPMTEVGEFGIENGVLESFELPAESVSILITNEGASLPPIDPRKLNGGGRLDQSASYQGMDSRTSQRDVKKKKPTSESAAATTPAKPKSKAALTINADNLADGVLEGEAMTMNNRIEIAEFANASGGKVLQVAEGHSIGLAYTQFDVTGPFSFTVALVDGPNSGIVKFYVNDVPVETWSLNRNDGQLYEFTTSVNISAGDQIKVKLFGSEKLDKITW
ncbi:MAG: carbohydrate-binding protein [Puniceicoccales bacterium]